jgi:hypothetical protein
MAMNTFDILPAQPEPTEGWEIDYAFLEAVEGAALERGEYVHLEGVEAVLLAAFDLLAVYFPSGLRGG